MIWCRAAVRGNLVRGWRGVSGAHRRANVGTIRPTQENSGRALRLSGCYSAIKPPKLFSRSRARARSSRCSWVVAVVEEPITIVDLVNDKTGLANNHVRDHGIVDGIGVSLRYSCVLIFVGADRDKPAIANL
jgi:hypothetical protein